MSTLFDLYSERKNSFQEQLQKVQQHIVLISWTRVIVVVAMMVLFYYSLQISWLWIIDTGALIAYIFLVNKHENLKYQQSIFNNLVTINEREIAALNNDHSAFETGDEFLENTHPYTLDLDIFGTGSLFQRVNRTCTEPGKGRLALMLSEPLTDIPVIRQRQSTVKELNGKIDFRQHFQAVGMVSPEKKEDQKQLLAWLDHPNMVLGKNGYKTLLIVLPLFSIASLIFWIVSGLSAPFIILSLIQLSIIGSHAKRVTLFQDFVGNKRFILEKFSEHFRLLQNEKFITNIMNTLAEQSTEARHELGILAGRTRALNLRLNLLATMILNSTVLYDLWTVLRLEQWREKNREHLPQWLHAIQEADALNSLGTYAFNHPEFVFPEITNELSFSAADMGHPLIKHKSRVCNTVSMDNSSHVWIVTGANMAGKSTFLRTVGINTVMALTGMTVCATSMRCPLLEIYTGMRNTDSISENQSYFFAELLRLQKIISQLRQGKKMLILLDEILKGTNSIDKLSGSEELIKQFVSKPCLTMVATHDVALGDMTNHYAEVKNFHFETFIEGDELMFDYLLKQGVSTGKNATFLMKKMGIINSAEQS